MFYHKVYKTSYFIVKDQHLAQDVTQETFIKAFKSFQNLNDYEKLESWLTTITVRTSLDFLRKEKRWNHSEFKEEIFREDTIDSFSSSIESIIEYQFLKNTIHNEIMDLNYVFKEVLVLKYYCDMKDEEFAKELNLNIGTVKSRLYRAKKKLKDIFENDPDIKEAIK